MCGRRQGGYLCEHQVGCVVTRRPVTVSQGNRSLTGSMTWVSPLSACVDLERSTDLELGTWVVLRDDGAMRPGFDGRVVGRDGNRYRVVFDPALIAMMSELNALAARGAARRADAGVDGLEGAA